MKTIIKTYFFFVILFFLSNCSSPLEDIEIDDFNLIRAKYNITKEISSNGDIYDNIELVIEDKNFMNFELKGAEITVNGEKMQYDNSLLVKKYISDLLVEFNKDYTFEITLANKEKIKTTLTTPYIDYKSIAS
ncbi:MAG: hypothetical protein L3J08_09500 [Flavobacteriaceae bacterium]|nr:hypothetical protein [Flavobacteriaceae bacterium]